MDGATTWGDVCRDLLFGVQCLGCAAPGSHWCRYCRAAWVQDPPTRVGDLADRVQTWAAAPYQGDLRLAIVAHKERSVHSLAPPLGQLLARAVHALVGRPGGDRIVLVPVPSPGGAGRRRGYDATACLTRRAAGVLRGQGHRVVTSRLLRMRFGTLDQAGLGRRDRSRNLHRAMRVSRPHLLWLTRQHHARTGRVQVVVCDDITTTGATLREAVRAVGEGGFDVRGAAVVARVDMNPR